MAVRVVTDSTSYLPDDLRKTFGISVVSLGVVFSDGAYREEDLEDAWFYAKMASSGEVPTSSQPSVAELTESFTRIVEAGDDVVGVFISSAMSGTFSTAQMVAEQIRTKHPDAVIELVDSRSNCMQLGFAALAAAEAAAGGASAAQAVSAAHATILCTRFVFTPHTLDYLRKGGRIGGASALLGTLLQIKPILTVEKGETDALDKVRTKRKAMTRLVDLVAADVKRAGLRRMVVHHIDDEAEGREVVAMVRERFGIEPPLYPIGPVIGLHVGPTTVGIVVETERPLRDEA